MSITSELYNAELSIAPGIMGLADVDLLKTIYKPSDLYWTHVAYQIECRNGNLIHCDDFYGREERMRHVILARGLLAECVFIARLYPSASWTTPTMDK